MSRQHTQNGKDRDDGGDEDRVNDTCSANVRANVNDDADTNGNSTTAAAGDDRSHDNVANDDPIKSDGRAIPTTEKEVTNRSEADRDVANGLQATNKDTSTSRTNLSRYATSATSGSHLVAAVQNEKAKMDREAPSPAAKPVSQKKEAKEPPAADDRKMRSSTTSDKDESVAAAKRFAALGDMMGDQTVVTMSTAQTTQYNGSAQDNSLVRTNSYTDPLLTVTGQEAAAAADNRSGQHSDDATIRPGAIRVHQLDDGAFMERADSNIPHQSELGNATSAAFPAGGGSQNVPSFMNRAITAVLVEDEEEPPEPEPADENRLEEARQSIMDDAVVAGVARVKHDGEDDDKSDKSSLIAIAAICLVVVIGGVAGVVFAVVGGGDGGSSANSPLIPGTDKPSQLPIAADTRQPTQLPTLASMMPTQVPTRLASLGPTSILDIALHNRIKEVLGTVSDPSLFTLDTPQKKALEWLIHTDKWFSSIYSDELLKERYILVLLYYATQGEAWFDQHGFLNAFKSICQWGVDPLPGALDPPMECVPGDQRLLTIRLTKNNLDGTLPSELGSATLLQDLLVGTNLIKGGIPSELGKLTFLQQLQLGHNSLSGTVPSEIGELTALRTVNLDWNEGLFGPLPTQIQLLGSLNQLAVENTQLTEIDIICSGCATLSLFRSDCRDDQVPCSCCTHCCLGGLDCQEV